jgi:23S rRNA pseudouridine2605 synthase
MRLAKYLAHAGVASRRASEEIIAAGRVRVLGKVVTDPARDVDDTVEITVDGVAISAAERPKLVYALHKPPGVVSTAHDPQGRPTVVDYVADTERLYPVGRLDVDTTGLILLTNDGDLANKLTHPRYEVAKTYRVKVSSRCCARASSSTTGSPRRRWRGGSPPTRSRSRSARAATGRCGAWSRRSATA